MIEKELKFKISEKEAERIQKKLGKMGCWPKRQTELTAIFDDKNYSFLKKGKTIRIRTVHLINPRGNDILFNNTAFLVFKDDSLSKDFNFNNREEIEIQITDFRNSSDLISFLYRLGYHCVLIYEKERENWLGLKVEKVKVSVDGVSELGYFLEIEGEEEKVKEMVHFLKLKKKKSIRKTTYQLYGKYLKKTGKSFKGIYISNFN